MKAFLGATTLLALVSGCQLDAAPLAGERFALVGGQDEDGYEGVPYLITTAGDGTQTSCSGALIAPSVVLTAAHCVDNKPGGTTGVLAYFGTHYQGDDPGFVGSIEAQSWEVFDPGWDFDGDDIAVVVLGEAALAQPLPFNATPLGEAYVGEVLTLVGWGRTSAEVADAGRKRVVDSSLTRLESDVVLNYGNDEANHCYGDSGGPGLMHVDGEFVIVSVASWQTGECRGRSGGTRVAAYSSWLSAFVAGESLAPIALEVVSPSDGDEVELGFELELAVSTEGSPLSRIEVFADGQLAVVDEAPTEPFVYQMPKTLSLGPVELEVSVRDGLGATASQRLRVDILAPSPPAEPDEPVHTGCRSVGGSGGSSSVPLLLLLATRRRWSR